MWLTNPAFLFCAIWIFVLGLFSLHLSDLLAPLLLRTVWLVVGGSVAMLIGWLIESIGQRHIVFTAKPCIEIVRQALQHPRVGRRLRTLWTVFLIGILLEVAYFRGAPLPSLFGIGTEVEYYEYGIPGYHGLLNSLFYTGAAINFARYLLSSRGQGSAWKAFLPLLYPIAMVSRQGAISLFVEYFLLYLLLRRPSVSLFVRSFMAFIVVFLLFGYMGDIRSGRDAILQLAQPTFDYPDWLPSAFIWFYIYACSPINNVNFNIGVTPNFIPIETLGSFIPTFARELLFGALGIVKSWELANESFNVGSFFQSILSDFGVEGTIVFLFLCSVGFARIMRRSRTNAAAMLALVVILHGIALSFFANLLFHLVFMFQIVFGAFVLRGQGIVRRETRNDAPRGLPVAIAQETRR